MKEKVTIVGAGVAGLSSAIRLAQKGVNVTVIEAGKGPSHKICGEFLSPECIALLNSWEIYPYLIEKAQFYLADKQIEFSFPSQAGALSHLKLDELLIDKAKQHGVEFLFNTKVKEIEFAKQHNKQHKIIFENNTHFLTKTLFLATGRWGGKQKNNGVFVGIKAHLNNSLMSNQLKMFAMPGAYVGLAKVDENTINFAALITKKKYQKQKNIENVLKYLCCNSTELKKMMDQSNVVTDWMTCEIPKFGIKNNSFYPNVYYIGDAFATIPPACGAGLSLSILGGCLAAECYCQYDAKAYHENWQIICKKPIRAGKMFHHILANPFLGKPLIRLTKVLPNIPELLFKKTRIVNHIECG